MRKPAKSIGAKRGFHDQTLIRHWVEFVGDEIARLCRPREIRRSRSGAVLIVECMSAYASELAMRSEEIRARINSHFGAETIVKIQWSHQHLGFQEAKPEIKPQNTKPREIPEDLKHNLSNAQNDALRDALRLFSEQFYNKGS